MMRYAPWAMALALLPIAVASPAHAGRSRANVAVVATFGHPPFFHPFFHPFFRPFHPVFFRSTVFVGAPVFAPPPVAFFQPPVYYVPPPMYAYPPPGVTGAPSGGTSYRPEDCRRYETTITIDGKPQPLVDTVCKGPDGNWHRAQ